MTEAKCRSCGAPIVWTKTTNGKRMPLDAKPELRMVLDVTTGVANVVDAYTSHFATCPDAADHRRKR